MKKVKLSVVSAVTVGLLASSTIAVAAQDRSNDPIDPCTTPITAVSGQIYWGTTDDDAPPVVVDRHIHRELIHTSRWDLDDDRLDGKQEFLAVWDTNYDDTGIHSGTIRIVNDDGGWSGTVQGVGPSIGSYQEFTSLTGDGAYEGLSASLFGRSGSTGPLEGAIYPTDLPSCDFASMQ
jgi:hypothetical protein